MKHGLSEEKQETTRAAAAFLDYCALGPARSLAKLADNYGKTTAYLRQLEKWSSEYKWVERAKQFDAEQVATRLAKKQAERSEMENRHAEEAREEQKIARELLMAGAKKGKVSLAAVQWLKNSREDERKALVEEEMPSLSQGGTIVGIAIYLPQKQSLKGDNANGHSES